MLLERRPRSVRGVRLIARESAPFSVQIVPLRRLTTADVQRTLDGLDEHRGPIVTSALSSVEQRAFLDVGFVELESLRLLRHDFVDRPATRPVPRIRRARRTDLSTVLAIDAQGFDPFWQLDGPGLHAARRATPVHRYRVAVDDHDAVVGYAVTGVASATSYLQRLGVHHDHRGRGVGTALVADAIDWAIRRGTVSMMVNTQETNEPALRLYEALGFRGDEERLRVLQWPG